MWVFKINSNVSFKSRHLAFVTGLAVCLSLFSLCVSQAVSPCSDLMLSFQPPAEDKQQIMFLVVLRALRTRLDLP